MESLNEELFPYFSFLFLFKFSLLGGGCIPTLGAISISIDLANPSMASSVPLDFGMGVEVAEGPGNLAAILVLAGAGVTDDDSGSSGLTS